MAALGFEEGIGVLGQYLGGGRTDWRRVILRDRLDRSPSDAGERNETDPATTQALIAAAGDKSWIVQTAALEALAKRGDRSVLQTVEQYLSDERDAVKFTAAAAVVRLGAIKAASKSARDH
jgi:HEAT repeat protein